MKDAISVTLPPNVHCPLLVEDGKNVGVAVVDVHYDTKFSVFVSSPMMMVSSPMMMVWCIEMALIKASYFDAESLILLSPPLSHVMSRAVDFGSDIFNVYIIK